MVVSDHAYLFGVWKRHVSIDDESSERILTVSGEQCDCSSLGSCTTGTANAMDVVLRVVGIVVVQDMCDVLDVFIGVSNKLEHAKTVQPL